MLRIRASARRGLPVRNAPPSYMAELYDVSGRSERLDWHCEHDHDNLFAALVCGESELERRQVNDRLAKRRPKTAVDLI